MLQANCAVTKNALCSHCHQYHRIYSTKAHIRGLQPTHAQRGTLSHPVGHKESSKPWPCPYVRGEKGIASGTHTQRKRFGSLGAKTMKKLLPKVVKQANDKQAEAVR